MLSKLLIANRGEIAVRVMRTAAEMGIATLAVYPEDDARALHVSMADESRHLSGSGAAAYLDIAQIVAVAKQSGCDAVHPGYGFLSENAAFARACGDAGITFVGPRTEILELFGDKVRARKAASAAGVPVLPGSAGPVTLEEAGRFLADLPMGQSMIIKAVAGGGGRGVRIVSEGRELESAFARCQSEARAAFGDGSVYVERLVRKARHIEVQIVGDGSGAVSHIGERECSLQRRHQKLMEIAPAPGLSPAVRDRIHAAAIQIAQSVRYNNLGTIEFLVDADSTDNNAEFFFIEANARLQVEHTVTEAVTGLDLVQVQLELAAGRSLAELGLLQADVPAPRGFAIQARVNMERMAANGATLPSTGTLTAFDPPSGPGIRVDTFGYGGYTPSPRYDSLLAKVIAHSARPNFADAVFKTRRALEEFRIEGLSTNAPFLLALLGHRDFVESRVYTRFIEEHIVELVAATESGQRRRHVEPEASRPSERALAGARLASKDPLAVLAYGKAAAPGAPSSLRTASDERATPDGMTAVAAPLQGTVVSISVREGDEVRPGQSLLVMESMKMEHEVRALASGIVRRLEVAIGDTIYEGHTLILIEDAEVAGSGSVEAAAVDLDAIRPDLRAVLDRRLRAFDAARPDAVARRRKTNHRTARENIEHLCDPGTFVEYGPLVLAAQAARRSTEELIEKSPADGMITGVGRINGDIIPEPESRCVVMSYDYTVFAGTQGGRNHMKTDRLIDVATLGRMPLVLFAEGGGGRPGDTEGGGGTRTFARFATLSGLVPLVGITTGRCFAGNASLLGCCDVIIATEDSNIGMGGPAMIEGGGLGIFAPEEIGPMAVQVKSGVVDIAVTDEAEAVTVAKQYLSYFQGPVKEWESPDQRVMRGIVPENRLRVYDVRAVIETLADTGSVLELRRHFGLGMVTALVRVEGKPLGVVANNPVHLGGAIDSDGADKAARFMQLCDAFDIPLLFLCDTPGIMVGPEIEKTALVRHSSRMFLIGANLSVPFFTIVLRKSYGLGGIAMAAGSFRMPMFSVAWPTGEFGGMGLEGSVKLGYRDELAAIQDPEERKKTYETMVARAYERGKAINHAAVFAMDDTIDPAESRWWVASMLASIRPTPRPAGKKRANVDAW